MKFFTQGRLDALQASSDEEVDLAIEDWNQQIEAYDEHFKMIQDELPQSVRTFSEYSFHDAVVRNLAQPEERRITLELEVWPGKVSYRISFLEVKDFSLPDPIVDCWWLYEEVSLHDTGQFRLDILFTNAQGFIVADSLEMAEIPA